MKVLLTLLILSPSLYSMEPSYDPTKLVDPSQGKAIKERIALLGAYRLGQLEAQENGLCIFRDPFTGAQNTKDLKSIASYFRGIITQPEGFIPGMSRDSDIAQLLLEEKISRDLFFKEFIEMCNPKSAPYKDEFFRALDNGNHQSINSVLAKLKDVREKDYVKTIDQILEDWNKEWEKEESE